MSTGSALHKQNSGVSSCRGIPPTHPWLLTETALGMCVKSLFSEEILDDGDDVFKSLHSSEMHLL